MDDKKKMKLCLCIAVTSLAIRGACAYSDYKSETQSYESVSEIFDEGEHIISVPIKGAFKRQQQYDYHEGYKVVDIEKDFILYVNEEPVYCVGYVDKNEESHFTEFGNPIEKTKTLELKPTKEEK